MANLVQTISSREFCQNIIRGHLIKGFSDMKMGKVTIWMNPLLKEFYSPKFRGAQSDQTYFGVAYAISELVVRKGMSYAINKIIGRGLWIQSNRIALEINIRTSSALAASALYSLIIPYFSETATENFSELAEATMLLAAAEIGIDGLLGLARNFYDQYQVQRRQNLGQHH